MKKTVLIISSVLLNVTFILMFIFLQSDKSDEQIKITLLKDQLYLEQQKNKQYDEDFSKAEFNKEGNLKSQRLIGKNEELIERYYYDDGKIKTEKTFVKSNPYEEIEYYRNGNLKTFTHYEKQNLVHIFEYYPNGQIKAQGKKIRRNGRNDEWHGRWIWYNQDGTLWQEKTY